MTIQFKNPEIEAFIKQRVQRGGFASPDDAIETAVEQMMAQRASPSLTPDDLAAIAEGDAQFERGEAVDLDDFEKDVRRKYSIE